jgi:AraC-like DNA-binding protein
VASKDHIQDESNEPYGEFNRVEQVKKYIAENMAADLRASVVAKKFELSFSSLHRLFKKHEGQAYHQYLEDIRMKTAFHLITREGKRISEAMYAMGYSNRSTFNAAFKKKFKHYPSHFRK